MISVILPTYNRCDVIERAIDSVLEQTYSNIELIIIDDCSTDNTLEVLSKYKDDRIHIFALEKNCGANYARNYGIKKAHGEWIAFIDSDNEWRKDKLDIQLQCIGKDDNIAFVFSAFERIEGSVVKYVPAKKEKISQLTREELADKMIMDNYVDTNTVLVKRKCFERVGMFDENLLRLQDWEMFYRVLEIGKYEFAFIDQPLVKNYLQKNSLSYCNYSFLTSRLYFLKKYMDIIVAHGKEQDFISDLLVYPCTDISMKQRVELIDYTIADRNINYTQAFVKALSENQKRTQKFKDYYYVLDKWVELKQDNYSLAEHLEEKNYRKIAIYGYGRLGQLLTKELSDTNIKIVCIIDQFGCKMVDDIPVYAFENIEKLEVDSVIVTVINEFEEIKTKLQARFSQMDVVSLLEVVRNIIC